MGESLLTFSLERMQKLYFQNALCRNTLVDDRSAKQEGVANAIEAKEIFVVYD